MSKKLINQLHELKGVNQAPVLWRSENRENLLRAISADSSKSYNWVERMNLWQLNFRHTLAPIRLAPMLASLLLIVVGAVPFANAMNASLPGGALYPVKRLAEKVELSWFTNSQSQGLYYLQLASRRVDEMTKISAADSKAQANLLRDYNIDLAFAQASLQSAADSSAMVAKFDQASFKLANELRSVAKIQSNSDAYKVAMAMTDKLSSNSLAILVNTTSVDAETNTPVADRLNSQIAQVEDKLNSVDVNIVKLPENKPTPRVVIESKQAIVPIKEATKQAKESLDEAKKLVAKKNFSLALQKVQEVEDITKKSEDAITKAQTTNSTDTTNQNNSEVKPVESGKVEGATDAKPAAGETKPETRTEIKPQ